MSKPEQVLIIEPQNELRFKGPFNVPVTSYMKLTNPSDKKVLFKIKTTAPKKYCVRPNSGLLEPNANTEIAVCLQPFIFEPSEKNKHKFMVQTVFAPDGDFNLEQLWKDISAEQLMDSKLKCVFELPADKSTDTSHEETAKVSPKIPPLQNATSGVPVTSSTETELEKAAAEVQQLREEESALRQENFRLKEEVLRLQKATAGANQQSVTTKYTPMVATSDGVSWVYLGLCILVAMVGIFMGKFLL